MLAVHASAGSQPSLAEWLTAIGTLAAVVVALGLSLMPPFVRWWRRPRLDVRVGQQEPHVRPMGILTAKAGRTPSEVRLRLEIRNTGHLEARRVRVSVRRWWARTDSPGRPPWVRYDIEPLPLRWVSAPRPATAAAVDRAALETDLTPGDSDYVDLSRYAQSGSRVSLCSPDGIERPFRLDSNYPESEHRAEVVVAAENAALVRQVVTYRASPQQWISDVAISEAPDEKDVLPIGLLELLNTARGE